MPSADNAILLLGAQRSGTTWLGKIFDSHPDVLYRHEPDHGRIPRRAMDATLLRATLATWIDDRSQRAAAKRPFFRKSWQSAPAFWLRGGLTALLAAGARLPLLGDRIAHLRVPDLGDREAPTVRAALKSIDWCDGVGAFARLLPNSRTVAILRHPCGQVASVMRGNRQGRFSLREAGTDMPFEEALTLRFAAERGIDDAAFQALPDAAKYAWDWVRFNETALRGLQSLPNARIVVYEELCTRPAEIARELLEFCGLDWNAQTEAFIAHSTQHSGAAGYYAVFRDSIVAAERWRTDMTAEDQAAVRNVVGLSPLRQFWDDLG
ncbi:MAG: sulfotransferase [Rhodospirillales bacterium]